MTGLKWLRGVLILVGLSAGGCQEITRAPSESVAVSEMDPEGFSAASAFQEEAGELGLEFQHFNGAEGEYYLPEIMGSGGALFDYDGDGDLDAYLIQGGRLKTGPDESESSPAKKLRPVNRLFQNQMVETGRLGFRDVTDESGVGHPEYGMGAAIGDIEGDGDLDLYVTNFGSNVLYRNNGDGSFSDVTRRAGVDDPRWSASASFFDSDKDGDLDLFVTNYVDFTVQGNKECFHAVGVPDYCSPSIYNPLPDRLFQNQGDGRFVEVTSQSGIGTAFGAGLGVACRDLNGDGWIDIYVANDGTPNQLWINRGDGTFENQGLLSGTAVNLDGLAEAGMGIASADFDQDGDEDLLITHLARETNTLYRNDGQGNFEDATLSYPFGSRSLPFTGFGTGWLDYDNDGRLDLFIANGAVTIEEALLGEPFPYHQPNHLFHQVKDLYFEGVFLTGGSGTSEVSRGTAFGDVDNDGDVDLLVFNNGGPARLLVNQHSGNRWLQFALRSRGLNVYGVGARVGLQLDGGRTSWQILASDGSYLSASDLRVHFGLGKDANVEGVLVEWPDGTRQSWEGVEAGRLVLLSQMGGQRGTRDPH